MNLKGIGADLLGSFGYTPEKLLAESDLKLNQLLSKMIMESKLKDKTVKTGFFIISENKEDSEGKPKIEFWLSNSKGTGKHLDIDLEKLIMDAIPENERAGIKTAETTFGFSMKDHLTGVYTVMNNNLSNEMEEQDNEICAVVLVGVTNLEIKLCLVLPDDYRPYKNISFIQFAKDNNNEG